jgi:putative ABC transport system permease protein
MQTGRKLDALRQDLRYGVRQLNRNPRFTVVAVLTLALGIGTNTAIFTVASSVLFRELPYREPDRLVQIWNNFHGHQMQNVVFSHVEFADYRSRIRHIEDIGAYGQVSQTLKGNPAPEQVWVSTVSANLFDLLGVQPLHGRLFRPDENQPGRTGVAIMSHALWQRHGGDPAMIGQSIVLDGEPLLVVGVMPATFRSPVRLAEVWRPLSLGGAVLDESKRGSRSLWMIGRLRATASLEDARREMHAHAQTIAAERRPQYPEQMGHAVSVVPLHEEVTGRVRRALLILLAAVGMVLLIACANVANLLLARATARSREMAVRGALGATRLRVVSQLLTESILLALLGGAAGTLLAVWSVDLLMQWIPSGVLPRMEEVSVDAPVLWFSLVMSLLTGLLFGLAAAVHGSSTTLMEILRDGPHTGSGGRRTLVRNVLTVAEVSLALILLVGAGLFIRSFARLIAVPPGFLAGNALTMRIALPDSKYSTKERQLSFFQDLADRTRTLPGVSDVGLVTSLPFSGWRNDWSISLEGLPGMDGHEGQSLPAANYFVVNRDYFRSMGIPVMHGRGFSGDDAFGTPAVIVNQTLARRFWPGQDPLGKRLKTGAGSSPWPWRTVVGVVGDVRQTNLETAVMPEIFVLNDDTRKPAVQAMFLVVRASSDRTPLAAAIRREVALLDADQAVTNIRSLAERVSLSLAERRFHLLLIAIFAGIAVALAVVGVHSIVAYSVGQRTREIGLRVALGAQKRDIFQLIVGQGMGLAAVGVVVGLAGSMGLARFLESLLFEIRPSDPLTFFSSAILLAATAFLACWLPAMRAARVDPVVALRHE